MFRQSDRVGRTVNMFLVDDVNHLLDDVRMLGSDVVVFVKIDRQVIQAGHAFDDNHLPIAFSNSNLIGFRKLPV